MKRLGGLLLIGLLLGSATVKGQEATKVTTKPVAKYKTEYKIYGESVDTITTVEKANASPYMKMADGPLFETVQKTLKNFAFITSVVQTPVQKTTETNKYWDYEQIKAKSSAFVVLSLNTPITLLFQIEETYKKCIIGKNVPSGGYDDNSSSTCKGETSLNIKGPLTVYGNFATAVNVDALMKDKAEIDISLSRGYSDDLTLKTRFSVKSPSFDSNLGRLFRVLNIPVFSSGKDVGIGAGLLDNASPLSSRQTLLLGIARIARQAHERMLVP